VTLHGDGARVDGVRVRAHGRRMPCRLRGEHGAGRHALLDVELEAPAERTAPGQVACLYDGDIVVGHGTIAA
jgi:tRNA-uridine 2-sulfurtransferase